MTRGTGVRIAVLFAAGLAVAVSTAQAQDGRAAAREVAAKWQSAVVNVRVVLKMRMSMGGREMQASDDPVDTVGTVIDPSGLTVLSLGALNPGGMMTRLMGSAAAAATASPTSTSPPNRRTSRSGWRTGAKSRRGSCSGTRISTSRSCGRPSRWTSRWWPSISAPRRSRSCWSRCCVLTRLGRVGGWAPGASLHDVSAIIERPRTFYVLAGGESGVGTPAFNTSGKIIGLLTLRQVDAGRANMSAIFGSSDAFGMLGVILPAEDVLEIAKQAPAK